MLADEVIPVAELSRAEAERRLAAAQAAYDAADKIDMPAEDAALDRIQSAQAMLDAARGRLNAAPDVQAIPTARRRHHRRVFVSRHDLVMWTHYR